MGAVLFPVAGSKVPEGARVLHYLGVTYWAERGFIHSERDSDGAYESCTVAAFAERADALLKLNEYSRRESPEYMRGAIYKRDRDAIEGMLDLCYAAREQGEVSNPDARKEAVRRRPTTVVVPRAAAYEENLL